MAGFRDGVRKVLAIHYGSQGGVLDKLDKTAARCIFKFLYERVGRLDDPRQIGEPLQGTLTGLWRCRVGDYQIICTLEHDPLVVLVLCVGHRQENLQMLSGASLRRTGVGTCPFEHSNLQVRLPFSVLKKA